MNWKYSDKEIESVKNLPKGTIGFVYIIENSKTNQYYIGKKNIYKKDFAIVSITSS